MKKTEIEEPRRYFLGKLDGFLSKEERNFEKKHLKAYKRGDKFFFHGYTINDNGTKSPNIYFVKEEWK